MATAPPTEANEARLVDIARAHVRKFGHARTTVVGVAADAGMTHANVYRYFPSKSALLDEVVASGLRPLEARLREAADGADPAHDKLERMLIAVHRDYRAKLDDDPAIFDLLVEALARNRPSARKHRARARAVAGERLDQEIEYRRIVVELGAVVAVDRDQHALELVVRRIGPVSRLAQAGLERPQAARHDLVQKR